MKTYLVKVQFEAANDAEARQLRLRLVRPGIDVGAPVEQPQPVKKDDDAAHTSDEIGND